jgi:hypothetical protein
MLRFQVASFEDFKAIADSTELRRIEGASVPEFASPDIPDWCKPDDCAVTIAVYAAKSDAGWDQNWATFCETNGVGHALAQRIE